MPRWLLSLLVSVAPVVAAPVPEQKAAKAQADLDRLWDGVADGWPDRVALYCALVRQPEVAVEYLTARLPPSVLTKDEVKQFIKALDSDDGLVWKPAFRELITRDPRLVLSLTDIWGETTTDRQRERLGWLLTYPHPSPNFVRTGLLYRLEPPGSDERWNLWTSDGGKALSRHHVYPTFDEVEKRECCRTRLWQADIAVAALERIGTPAARKHLDALAGGHPDARSRTAAVAAVKRLDGGVKAKAKALDTLWLLGSDELARPATVNQFLDQPSEAVAFLKGQLKPLVLSKADADKLLVKLFGDNMDECRAAVRELIDFDLRLAMTVEDAWKQAKTPTQRGRLVTLFTTARAEVTDSFDPDQRHKYLDYTYHPPDKEDPRWRTSKTLRTDIPADNRPRDVSIGGHYVFQNTLKLDDGGSWGHEESAVYILDAIGTDEAVAIIKEMATGHPDARPTKAAKDVLKRRGVK